MGSNNFQLVPLTNQELVNIDGGFEPIEAILAVGAALYSIGYVIGVAIHHAVDSNTTPTPPATPPKPQK